MEDNIFLDKSDNPFEINIYVIGYDKQGESIYISIESKNRIFFYDILIDCYKTDKNRTMELLKKIKTDDEIKCICLTHYHDDHILGMDDVINKYSKCNTNILIPDTDVEESLSDNAKNIRKKVSYLRKNGRRQYGHVHKISDPKKITNNLIYIVGDYEAIFEVEAISPISDITIRNVDKKPKDIEQNDYSIALLITLGELRLLFTGDIMNNTLRQINGKYDINYLKIPHHGSLNSNIIFDIANVNKNTTCVTTNYKLKGLPHDTLLSEYSKKTDEIYLTQKDSFEDYGIVHTKYIVDIIKPEIRSDTECLNNSKQYLREENVKYF